MPALLNRNLSRLRILAGTLSRLIARLEDGLLFLLLLAMILLAAAQVILRLLPGGGMLWADPLLRHMVLWAGLFGAAAATSRGKHISLDVLSYLVPQHAKPWLVLTNSLFGVAVCLALTHAAVVFVRTEADYGGSGLLEIPAWCWGLVFPLAFGLISLRFLAAAGRAVLQLAGHPSLPAQPGGTPPR